MTARRIAASLFLAAFICLGADDGTKLAQSFTENVDRRLDLPEAEQQRYGELLANSLADKSLTDPQYVVIVDRSPFVQAVMIYWMGPDRTFYFIGASPVSTGQPGRFEHFKTPTGVFEHSLSNLDFRAEGTRNELGICGYGRKGMRVFDFGWQQGERGWGRGGESPMRLQMHATDPDILEKRLGTAQPKGCIRIPATLNSFIDQHGILDRDYEDATAQGKSLWMLSPTRSSTPWSGRWLVVVDTERKERPAWAALPGKRK